MFHRCNAWLNLSVWICRRILRFTFFAGLFMLDILIMTFKMCVWVGHEELQLRVFLFLSVLLCISHETNCRFWKRRRTVLLRNRYLFFASCTFMVALWVVIKLNFIVLVFDDVVKLYAIGVGRWVILIFVLHNENYKLL